jgi:hypothetical protein
LIEIKLIIESLKTCQRHKAYDGDEFIVINGKPYLVNLLNELVREHERQHSPKAQGGRLRSIMKELGREPISESRLEQARRRLKMKQVDSN